MYTCILRSIKMYLYGCPLFRTNDDDHLLSVRVYFVFVFSRISLCKPNLRLAKATLSKECLIASLMDVPTKALSAV